MKVLLTTFNSKYIHTNLALHLFKSLYDFLEIKEYNIKDQNDLIVTEIIDYDIICFSCYIWNIEKTIEISKILKTVKKNIIILYGGPEVSHNFKKYLQYADYIISGEGEIPFKKFLKNYPNVENIDNLISQTNIFKKNYSVFDLKKYNNLNPYAKIIDMKNKIAYIETSRGCPFLCSYCYASLDNIVRYYDLEQVKKNLDFLFKNAKIIKFLDRTFNLNPKLAKEIFDYILENHNNNVFQFEITADILHEDIIHYVETKVPSNLFRFEIGIQSTNDLANLAVKRKQNFEKIKNVCERLTNIDLHLDLIVGLPYDYIENVKKSFNDVFLLFADELQLGFLKLLDGTNFDAKTHNYLFESKAPYEIIKSDFLDRFELDEIRLVESMLEIFYNKNRLKNTLKYVSLKYDIYDFLLNLGNYFIKNNINYFKYQIYDIFETFINFIKDYNDEVMESLVVFDYYKISNVRPKKIFLSTKYLEKENNLLLINLKIDLQQLNKKKIILIANKIYFQYENYKFTIKKH